MRITVATCEEWRTFWNRSIATSIERLKERIRALERIAFKEGNKEP